MSNCISDSVYTIAVAQYGSSWHTSSATIVSTYSAFSKQKTAAEIGGYIGLMHINITYRRKLLTMNLPAVYRVVKTQLSTRGHFLNYETVLQMISFSSYMIDLIEFFSEKKRFQYLSVISLLLRETLCNNLLLQFK